MNKQPPVIVFLLMLSLCATATAGEIYKRVNEDGLVEYSDTPFPGSEQIEVKPNVVQTNPVQPRQRESSPSSERTAEATESAPRSDSPERLPRLEQVEEPVAQRRGQSRSCRRSESRPGDAQCRPQRITGALIVRYRIPDFRRFPAPRS